MERLLIIALHSVSFLSTSEKLLLLETVNTITELVRLGKSELEQMLGRKIRSRFTGFSDHVRKAESVLYLCSSLNIRTVCYWDHEYPPQLREIYNPPFMLFYKGSLPAYTKPMISIVGTRKPDGLGREAAYSLGFYFAGQNIPVVSGLALGIDTEAHKGAVEYPGITIAVLGCGVDTIYPGQNKHVASQILENKGALISEYFPGTLPLKHRFPERNRIIAGLSRGVVVVQAPRRSGALITADFAVEEGREVYVHKAGTDGQVSEGSKRLLYQGAQEIYTHNDVLRDWFGEKAGASPLKLQRRYITIAQQMREELSGRIQRKYGKVLRRT
ncbi:MAG: DNA-processing protein DprA [Spirochaetia bacterium]